MRNVKKVKKKEEKTAKDNQFEFYVYFVPKINTNPTFFGLLSSCNI